MTVANKSVDIRIQCSACRHGDAAPLAGLRGTHTEARVAAGAGVVKGREDDRCAGVAAECCKRSAALNDDLIVRERLDHRARIDSEGDA